MRALLAHVAAGCSTAEAARLALSEEPVGVGAVAAGASVADGAALSAVRARLLAALIVTDEAGAQGPLDELFALADIDRAVVAVVLPVLREIGELWEQGRISVATEHYATNVVQSRLLALARGWDEGAGPQAILACLPGEQHALGLIAFGLVLRRRGWRIAYLGANTPLPSLRELAHELAPAAAVLASVSRRRFDAAAPELRELTAAVPLVVLGGAGASPALAGSVGARACELQPDATADALTAALAATRGR